MIAKETINFFMIEVLNENENNKLKMYSEVLELIPHFGSFAAIGADINFFSGF